MIERPALALAVGFGVDAARGKGERGSRRRSTRAPQHVWVERDDDDMECRWCRTRRSWPGATEGCGNAHAMRMASYLARRNEESPLLAQRALGDTNSNEAS